MKLKTAIRVFEATLGDAVLGVSTLGSLKGDYPEIGSRHGDSFWYESKSYYLNWLYLRPVRLRKDDVVYDIGCGAGRLLFVAALSGVKRCIGLELSEKLCDLARRNVANIRGVRTPMEIRQADAAAEDYSEATVFLLCNPFGAGTLGTVLDRIEESFEAHPREIRLVYIDPTVEHRQLFARTPWIRVKEEKTFPGARGVPALYLTGSPVLPS